MDVVAIALGLAAALCLSGGFVVEQHAAMQEPPNERLSFRLLLKLVQRPLWLMGLAVMVSGQLLGAAALGHGSLALVEPILALNLLFALPLAALWSRTKLGKREWIGALALVLGLVGFLAAGNPHGGSTQGVSWPKWVTSGGSIVLLAGAFVAAGRKRHPGLQATLLAAGAGTLYGLEDALTQRVVDQLGHGILATLVTWPVFSLVTIAILAMLLAQSAFEAAPLAASLPPITVAEPVTGIAFGVGVYGQHLTLAPLHVGIELVSFGVMVVGVLLVARSPIVTGVVLHPEELQAERRSGRRAA